MEKTQVERNPLTHEKHRREVFWQITIPLIIGLAFIADLVALTIVTAAQGGNVSQAADTSLIFLTIPTMLMAFVVLAVLAALAYGIIWMNKNLPPYFKKAQDAMVRVRDGVRSGADKLTGPVIRFKSMMASLEAFKRK
jgi:predicted membrane protein